MNYLKEVAILTLVASLVLGGCSILEFGNEKQDYELVEGENGAKEIRITEKERERLKKVGEAYREENYVPVQEYVGEGFTLEPDNGTDAIAENHKVEVEQAVKQFFEDNYKTEVKVHNIVGTTDAASVFVESVGEPYFYTLAIIPVDVKNESVDVEGVWSLEEEIEQAIVTGLLAMIYDEEFVKLDDYMERLVKEFPVTGRTVEALQNVGADKYTTPYYSLSSYSAPFKELLELYLKNPDQSKEDWKSYGKDLYYESEKLIIAIDLFMSMKDTEPDGELIDKIASDIEKITGFPRAKYVIDIHDNFIDKTSGSGGKENSISRGNPDLIIKE